MINLGRIDGPVAYDHRLLSTDDGRTVQDFTVRVHLDPRDTTATAQLDQTRQRATDAVNAAYNQGFQIGDDQFHVTVEFTDDPADAHTSIALHGDTTPATTQTVWTTASSDLDLAHEIGHYLGLADENIDNIRVFNRDDTARHATDDSL
ncbi:hypothetical protein, partial [Actinoplanes awajinensis]|uniref:hypothetical protein n=1 Tax=Actinoplanes awajinensis TaxID=135946 RepID=UPI0012F9AF43